MEITPKGPLRQTRPEPEKTPPSRVAALAASFFEGLSTLSTSLKRKVTKEVVIDREALWIDLLTKTNAYYSLLKIPNPFCVEETALKDLQANRVGETTSRQFSFIASQMPSYYEFIPFWEEIFKGRYSAIIDLTSLRDLMPGAPRYYPETREVIGPFSITASSLPDERTTLYTVAREGEEKPVLRYHFNEWLDGRSVSVDMLLFLITSIEEKFRPSKERPLWIHCRAGVGRTGTLITAFILKEKIESREITKKNLGEALNELIFALRKERSQFFVETFDQFSLLLSFGEYLLEAFMK